MRGRRGSDWVLPGTSDGFVTAARVAASAVGAGLAAAVAGGASGRARAAAQVTPIEEARIPRMLLSLDIVRQICPSRS
ncbi:hypothetical protein GCM10010261_54220 [Streptomyces pilosus]|uniref:Uncharacterized protein n=1 Tax=Streptomyces pilosus TaxID=28893 RepID=A0A918F422_9ACTN|nr:hypothetical protein GCM10010280_53650 [Streptomyces pilosus]GGV63770.1 hypothetical protein GCM10010261_54220 [Streptomyces pilosus]